MFDLIDAKIKNRMSYLEKIDKIDREDGTPRMARLRQIPPETGKFISLIASNCPKGDFIEIGTSAGYSTLWLVLIALERKTKIKTFEILSDKIHLAKETFKEAGVEDSIDLIEGDAINHLKDLGNISFCFLDAEKEIYESCWELISDKILPGGILIADNAISHQESLQPMIDKVLNDDRYDSLIVPVGNGELVCRRR